MANLEDNDSEKLTVDVTQDVADNFTSENYNSAIDKIDKKKDEIEKTITNNKSNIESAAKEFGVDKYVIAAIIYHEQENLSRGENFIDESAARYGAEKVSVGLGQIQVRRAIEVEDKVGKITEKEKREHGINGEWQARITRLCDPHWNIRYVTAYLQKLQNIRKPQFPEITKRPDILATIYNLGKTDAHPNPEANDYGKAVNKLIPRVKQLIG